MSTKHFIVLLLALFCGMGAMAQTDVTDCISDPDFEQEGRSQWKTNSFGRQGNNDFPLKHGGYYREVWSGGTAGDAYIYQDLTNMPVGTYTMTVACQNVKQSNKNQVCTGTWIYANDQKTNFNKPADYTVTCVVTDGNLRIGAEIKNCTGNYVCIDNVRLSYVVVFEDVKDYLESLVDEANKLDQHDSSKTQRLKHIAQGGADTKLNQGGNETSYSGIYVPTNNAAIAAYMSAGRYDNFMKSEQTTERLMSIGFKQTTKVENDQLVIDGFKLFYYGTPGQTGIEDIGSEVSSHEVEGYYNLSGVRISQPVRGVTIVKYKDGRSVKVKK